MWRMHGGCTTHSFVEREDKVYLRFSRIISSYHSETVVGLTFANKCNKQIVIPPCSFHYSLTLVARYPALLIPMIKQQHSCFMQSACLSPSLITSS